MVRENGHCVEMIKQRSVLSWAGFAIALLVGAQLSNQLEVVIVKARIRKLIAATKAR